MHMVGLEGIVPQLSGPGGCGMGGGGLIRLYIKLKRVCHYNVNK